jgi:hypothetical protein
MPQVTTVGRLLQDLDRVSPTVRDTVVRAAGLSPERAEGSMTGELKLKLSEQLRVSEATILIAPDFSRSAMRLRAQILAARSFENHDLVDNHRDAPADPWERAANLRR